MLDLKPIAVAIEQVRGDIDLHRLNYESADPAGHGERMTDHCEELVAEVERLRRELDQCAKWFHAIRLQWKRWGDLLTLSGKPSTTQLVDAWLEARAAMPATPESSGMGGQTDA